MTRTIFVVISLSYSNTSIVLMLSNGEAVNMVRVGNLKRGSVVISVRWFSNGSNERLIVRLTL